MDHDRLIGGAIGVAREAARAIAAVYARADPGTTTKADGSPLTDADRAAQAVIAAGLARLAPEIPVVSEEAAIPPPEVRARWDRCWIVDPLDGTREFLARNGDFTVNIALVERGVPVLGVVVAPALDRAWWGSAAGAFVCGGDGEPRAIRAAAYREDDRLVVAASRSHGNRALSAFLDALPAHRLVSRGSSLKFCLVAEGRVHLSPRTGPTNEWDTAAAHAVVLAAGGRVVDFDGTPLRYNTPQTGNPWFVVTGDPPAPWEHAARAARRSGENA